MKREDNPCAAPTASCAVRSVGGRRRGNRSHGRRRWRVASSTSGGANPIVRIDGGFVRGAEVAGVYSFRGLPYAAPPTGNPRWRAPQPAAPWPGAPDATQFGLSCWQPEANNPFFPPGPVSEDCLHLNVSMPAVRDSGGGAGPCSCGSTAEVSPRTAPATTMAPGLRRTAASPTTRTCSSWAASASPSVAGRASRCAGAVARRTAATGRDGLRRRAPLLGLVRRITRQQHEAQAIPPSSERRSS